MSPHEELESFVREQRLRLLWKTFFVSVCGIILFGVLALHDIFIGAHETVGTVLAPYAEPTEPGMYRYLIVRLDDGQVVRALISGVVLFRKDRRVAVMENTTMFFGYKRYKFLRYLDETGEHP